MLDRAFTFSDQRIIEKLQKEFVPAVGNTHELQNQKSPAAEWFMGVARSVNPRVNEGITAQGFYVAGPDGKAYVFNNNRDPQRVLDVMNKALTDHKQDPPKKVTITPEELSATFCRLPGEASSTLRIFSRIRPLPADADVLNHGVGRDHIWVYASDLQGLAGRKGRFPMPANLARRLTRYHLVDNVRGEPEFWKPSEIKEERFEMWSLGKGRFGFKGRYAMATANKQRGLRGALEGETSLDLKGEKVLRMRAYGEATAWGPGPYTPRPPKGEFPIKFAIVEAADEAARFTPPQAAAYGDSEYRLPK